MKLITELMLGKVTKEDFLKDNKITQIESKVREELYEAYKKHDANNVEIFVYLIFVFNLFYGEYTDILNELLLSDWHFQHENIAILLQKISDMKSMPYLYDAISLCPKYLLDDENCSFQIRCVRAIYYIGKEKSKVYLDQLCKNKNNIIKSIAQKQLNKINE